MYVLCKILYRQLKIVLLKKINPETKIHYFTGKEK
uniref:Uncharacterized protein n=1 Tax=Lepeophtheirus salmonis TaxID=72036 RepID=A0A0K2UV86_LEPSM